MTTCKNCGKGVYGREVHIRNPYEDKGYIIPIYGYIKYILPRNLKAKKYLIIFENTLLYFIVGMFCLLLVKSFSMVIILILIASIIFESWLYFTGFMKKYGFGIIYDNPHERTIAYLFTQAHAMSFLVLGYVMMLLLIGLWLRIVI